MVEPASSQQSHPRSFPRKLAMSLSSEQTAELGQVNSKRERTDRLYELGSTGRHHERATECNVIRQESSTNYFHRRSAVLLQALRELTSELRDTKVELAQMRAELGGNPDEQTGSLVTEVNEAAFLIV